MSQEATKRRSEIRKKVLFIFYNFLVKENFS